MISVVPGQRELHVELGLPLPDRLRFVPEVYFEKARSDPFGRHQLHVAVGDHTYPRHHGFMEALPVMESHLRNRDRAVLQRAIDGIHRELVSDEVVGDKNGILWAAGPPAGNLSACAPFDERT